MLDTLLLPLRVPGRVVSDIETLTRAVVGLQSEAKQHLSSVDDRAGLLVEGLGELRAAITRIEGKVNRLEEERMEALLGALGTVQASIDKIDARVEVLESLEETIKSLIGGLRTDLNRRMIAVQGEVQGMRPPLQEMARDVSKIDDLMPDPKDGPLTRLKDTLTGT